ncbi:PDF receptor-like [Mercenaria mercenaria]|uniref:PDF receptor-like n=1 Tax=Mercenaria mercenaria TaxID=6596 RepID=UPI00234E5977|nr:PDF receptor-like [Mercenaria mercenaria]XP_053399737.1 PDF receptor-like [Mercenaria mercenaria]
MWSDMRNFVKPIENCLLNITDMSGIFCNVTSDSVTCWPPTSAGSVAKQPCPSIFGAPVETYAYKRCDQSGKWAESDIWKGFGHSDYSECVGHLSMIEEVFDVDKEKLKEMETGIFEGSRSANIVFLVLLLMSVAFLVVSLLIIHCIIPRRLNQRPNYKIWRHLIMALIFQTVFKTAIEIFTLIRIKQVTPLCEFLITSLEYMDTAVYMWFMILTHLHQLTAQSGRHCNSGYITYILIGWGIPAIPITVWAVTSSLSYKVPCWQEYEFRPSIWILGTPRILILLTAILFLRQAFLRMSKNSELLNTNRCYRRLYLETLGCVFIALLIISLLLSKILLFSLSPLPSEKNVLGILCNVLTSTKGTLFSWVMLSFNSDTRGLLESSVRRISRQEQAARSVQEIEV